MVEEREFIVDGEAFLVRRDADGAFDCVWMTGPNPGYGFGSGAPASYTVRSEPRVDALPAGRASDGRITDAIRNFLSMIDPRTGFIGD